MLQRSQSHKETAAFGICTFSVQVVGDLQQAGKLVMPVELQYLG